MTRQGQTDFASKAELDSSAATLSAFCKAWAVAGLEQAHYHWAVERRLTR
jgi:hypothetical protein